MDLYAKQFEAHRRQLTAKAYRSFGYTLDEDLLDLLYTDCWTRISNYTCIRDFKRFVTSVYFNAIRDHIRRTAASDDALDHAPVKLELLDPEDSRLTDTRSREYTDAELSRLSVAGAFSTLPKTLADIGYKYYVEGRTIRDIAQLYGVHKGWVERRLTKFREQLSVRYQLELEKHDE